MDFLFFFVFILICYIIDYFLEGRICYGFNFFIIYDCMLKEYNKDIIRNAKEINCLTSIWQIPNDMNYSCIFNQYFDGNINRKVCEFSFSRL